MTAGDERVWDAGLQPERTYLAWRRLGLAFLGLALAVPRLAWTALDAWSIPVAVAVIAGAVVLLAAGHRRYRRTHASLTSARSPVLPDGRLPLLTVVLSLVLGAVALAVVASTAGPQH